MLLVDEVDKADVEVEGLLLEVLSDFQVTIPELGTMTAVRRPYVVLTSNATRELSEAVKRRCLFLHLDYPTAEREKAIVTAQVPDLEDRVAGQLVATIGRLRDLDLKKPPSIAESVDWARTLVALQIGTSRRRPRPGGRRPDPRRGAQARVRPGQGRPRAEAAVMSGLVDRHVDFLDALRAAGLQVSLAEGVDAVAALSALRWDDRETLRTAYAATLVKRQSHRPTFDTLFDLYFPRLVGGGAGGPDDPAARESLRDDLLAALVAGDLEAQQALAVDAVGRFGAMPGRGPGLSSWSAYTALRRLSPDDLVARIVEALTATGEEEAERLAPAASARSRRWSRRRPAGGSPRRRAPTTSPRWRCVPASTGSTSRRPRRPTSRRCAARSTRWPAGWRRGWPASSTPGAAARSTSGGPSARPCRPAASR